MFQLIRDLFVNQKMLRARREASTGELCVVCDSTDVILLAPQAYRCQQCGHEGGDGYASWQRQQRDAALRALPEEQRREGARSDLEQARSLLLSGLGSLESAKSVSVMDMVGVGGSGYNGTGGEGMEKQQLVVSASRPITEARNLVLDARVKLGGGRGTRGGVVMEEDYDLWAVDLHFDNVLADIAFHLQLERAHAKTQRLIGLVEEVLQREFDWAA